MKYYLIFGIWLGTIALGSCQSQIGNGKMTNVERENFPYILTADASYSMPSVLQEISGLTFVKGIVNTLYAVQDEQGILYEYDVAKEEISSTITFAGKGDYEEVTTDGVYFYVLKSNGDITSLPVGGTFISDQVIVNKGLVPKAEYESMAYDPSSGNLYLLCKVCKKDKKVGTVSGYILAIGQGGRLSSAGEFTLSVDAISKLDKKIKKTFKPSAMAKRSSSNEWYIVSSIDRTLVITDSAFKPKYLVPLDRKDFEQPEGVAFDESDNLYISSEAGEQKHGSIYRFNLNK